MNDLLILDQYMADLCSQMIILRIELYQITEHQHLLLFRGGGGQGKASVLNKVQLMQLSCHLDSLNYDKLLS